jgi:uncharacterized integral membrane protein
MAEPEERQDPDISLQTEQVVVEHRGLTWRERGRVGIALVLAVLVTIFAVLNTKEVKVNWIFGSSRAPLILVIVISLFVGVVLTYVAERRAARRRG